MDHQEKELKQDPLMMLVINAGSSSIKFALFNGGKSLKKTQYGQISRIGLPGTSLTLSGKQESTNLPSDDYASAIESLINWLQSHSDLYDGITIGHRVVHGMEHTEPALITTELLQQLKQIIPYDPDHLPNEIKLIEALRKHYPRSKQYACFDTAFHQTMPRVAKMLPIPRRFEKMGLRRYGFHGLSYNYLMQALKNMEGKKASNGKVVLAHLGNGASLAAVYGGKSMDTSMGFTPGSGVVMSSRSGDLDPGAAWFMMKAEKLSPNQFNQLVNHKSGLLGVSETSGDMSDLLEKESSDVRAAEAIELFCYEAKKWIGAFATVLGGIDTLIFTGGIGENSSVIRARICNGLQFLGIELNKNLNLKNQGLISKGKVTVRVMRTDEEAMIAKIVNGLIKE